MSQLRVHLPGATVQFIDQGPQHPEPLLEVEYVGNDIEVVTHPYCEAAEETLLGLTQTKRGRAVTEAGRDLGWIDR